MRVSIPIAIEVVRRMRLTRALWCGNGVERGLVTTDNFRAFTYEHALTLWGADMFANTVAAGP